ncbi:ABC transporter ATP-binding protein [Halobacterium litoreum]|uniref:ATP-binding cassette domain-containing protein n=1 Tax=Halobacterium litoreum TaxID=2039234 RepID=A0ABD5NFE3_9EURY|nr:ABC transporter ATP-binding protein [Halobacterium litoreum]UHH13269.1 ABC transporter ATP-binding protein [Halobacterium litoreum]
MPAIELSGVTKRFGDVTALHDLDLRVEDGEIYGFLGPNGAGKSTTIDILLDFVRPTSGRAEVLGMDAQANSKAIRQRTGVLPDGFHVYDRLTARQHLEFAIESKNADDDPEALLERVGIPGAVDRKAGGFSKGMAQRLALAVALVGNPDLIILDEPSTGLDPNGAREMRSIIQEEAERGATVFFSSHILEQVEAVCDRVGILQDGELVAEDTIRGLRDAAGTGTTLTVTVDAVTDAVTDAVRDVAGVTDVSASGDTLTVRTESAAKTDVLDAAESAGADVLDFATEEASLDDVFAAYTEKAEVTA